MLSLERQVSRLEWKSQGRDGESPRNRVRGSGGAFVRHSKLTRSLPCYTTNSHTSSCAAVSVGAVIEPLLRGLGDDLELRAA